MASPSAPIRLAIIDRDSGFLHAVERCARARGWESRVLARPASVDELVALRLGALVIDLALLGPHAWEYLGRVHARLPSLPVIVCSGRSSVAQRVRGLRMGADDWLTKPCHPEELIARIEASVRRARRATADMAGSPGVHAGELRILPGQFQAFAAEQSLDLTRREFEMLSLLVTNTGQVLEREVIYQHVWGYAMARGDRSVDVFIRKLRAKLERGSAGWRYIHTHFGVGYRFDPEQVDEGDRTVASEPAAAG